MPAPTFTLAVSGTDPKLTTKEILEAEVNRVVGLAYDHAETAIDAAGSLDLTSGLVGNNVAVNHDWATGPLGAVAIPATSGGYTTQQIPGWYLIRAASTGLGWPTAVEVVNNKRWIFSGTDRAVRARMVRASGGATGTDLQLRQIVPIPESLWGRTDIEVHLSFPYEVQSAAVAVTGVAVSFAALPGAGVPSSLLTTTELTPNEIGEQAVAAFTATITDPAARYVVVGPRLKVETSAGGEGSGTTAVNEDAWLGPVSIDFYRAGRIGWEPNRNELIDRRIAAAGGVQASDVYMDARGNIVRVAPAKTILVMGDSTADSLDDVLQALVSPRAVSAGGIGGETTTQILARMRGHVADDAHHASLTWTTGTKRLRSLRAVPPRTISETYRSQWAGYAARIASPRFVEFSNADGVIGRSFDQLRATATVAGATLTASSHPFVNGDQVYVPQASVPGNMYAGKVYYVREATGTTFKLAEFSGGPAISFSAFGGSLVVYGGFYFDWAYTTGADHTITVKTYTDLDELTLIIMQGTNDIGAGVPLETLQANALAIAGEMKTLFKRFVIPTIPGFYWLAGSAEHNKMLAYNAWLLREFRLNAVDVLGPLMAGGNGSADDNADIANGLVPRSLRIASGDGHLNTAGNTIVAGVLRSFLAANGW